MDERKTHYQVSFTARQALVLFVGFLLALGVAYFLGIMTGLVGREGSALSVSTTPAVSPTREASAAVLEGPPASAPPRPHPPEIVAARTPGSATGATREIQLFEDRGGPEPTAAPASRAAATPADSRAAEAFWVQVLSSSSEREARARVRKLSSRGYSAAIETVSSQKGTLYRVRVGPYRSRGAASLAADRLSGEEKVRAWIVPQGK